MGRSEQEELNKIVRRSLWSWVKFLLQRRPFRLYK